MYDCCAGNDRSQLMTIDFGHVGAGTIEIKSVKVHNRTCKKQSYEARRDPSTNPLDHVFNLRQYTWKLPPRGTFNCKIEYKPVAVRYKSIDYFTITDCDRVCNKIIVHGTCVGPNILPSVSKLVMVCPKGGREVKKRIQFTNNAKVAAHFMFDIDEKQSPYQLDILSGCLEPFHRIYITITFSPPDRGFYVCYLPCLVQNQVPIITELYGYYGTLFSKEDEFHLEIFTRPMPVLKGLDGYLNDSAIVRKGCKPPLSLSCNYLDFGRADVSVEKATQNIPQTICLTNHTEIDVLIKWDKDIERIFSVTPRAAQISAGQSAIFEAHFDPCKKDTLLARVMIAHIFWEYETLDTNNEDSPPTVAIPLVTSVRMIGHSFSTGTNGWIPQYDVPQTVVLPPCVPSLPVYTTFLIRRYGHLPIMFRFIPPRISHFIVKPMVGIIYRDFQIIALGLFPEYKDELLYVERWAIQFNGNPKFEIVIDFKGYAEYANLIFNDNQTLEFAPVYPECQQIMQVTMRNMTRHCIRYSFLDLPPELYLVSATGEINANEILTHDWVFCPSELGEYGFSVNCCVTTLQAGYPVGTTVDIPLEAVGRSELGYLVAIPEELNFGVHAYGDTKEMNFHVFNFSTVRICFLMVCKHRGYPTGSTKRDVKILPEAGSIYPGGSERISVCITPLEPGFYQLVIQYFMRTSPMAEDTVLSVKPRNICEINCICVLPGLEVKDLLYHGSGPNISKLLLWNVLGVTNFNNILKGIMPGEKRNINMCFPALVMRDEPFLIKLLVFNPTPIQSTWNLRRRKLCSCQQIPKSRSFTFKRMEYDCEHRSTCSIHPKEKTLQPNEETIIIIEVRYILLGKTKLEWDLTLTNDRHIVINTEVVTLSGHETGPLLLNGPVVSLENIYIGDMDPIYQMHWMYNSTDHDVTYCLDDRSLRESNKTYLSEVFSCKNPHGIVPGQTHVPLIFKFQPRHSKKFQVNIPLMLGDEKTELVIRAESSFCYITKLLSDSAPISDKFSIPEVPVHFNIDNVIISPMPMHSTTTRIIMISNDSKDDIIAYEWKSYDLPEMLRIDMNPLTGRIQPGKAHSVCLKLHSKSHSCKINANVTCEFANISASRLFGRDIIKYNALCKELEGQFTITEKGVSIPEPKFEVAKKPVPFHKAVAVSCYVYSSADADLKLTLQEQLQCAPSVEITTLKTDSQSIITEKQIDMATFALEGIIWDILNSKLFKNVLEENLTKVPDIEYSQLMMHIHQRQKLLEQSYLKQIHPYSQPILEQMILMMVHEEYGLDAAHSKLQLLTEGSHLEGIEDDTDQLEQERISFGEISRPDSSQTYDVQSLTPKSFLE